MSAMIEFHNMQACRVGNGIRLLRERMSLSSEELAKKLGIRPTYLERIEEGYEPAIQRHVLEDISQIAGISRRGKRLSDDLLLNMFLYATVDSPPSLV